MRDFFEDYILPYVLIVCLAVGGLTTTYYGSKAAFSVAVYAATDHLKSAANASVRVESEIGHGSGVVVAPGLVVTAKHVVDDNKTVKITLANGEVKEGSVAWTTAGADDVALIAVDTSGVTPAPINCDQQPIGTRVFSFGDPLSMRRVATWGRIASDVRVTIKDMEMPSGDRLLDMTVNPGNSGGGIFLENGQLVGLADAVMITPLGGMPSLSGLAVMVPSETVCRLLARK